MIIEFHTKFSLESTNNSNFFSHYTHTLHIHYNGILEKKFNVTLFTRIDKVGREEDEGNN